ncbi:glucan endo-1,3-beta-glucosidase 8 [Canna indica]|uniref:glucan endo-1,3-beta-D-glucosidase n=1 Tax=Canna indica TaxID=4628 RepID=A0AAQ3KCF9_9LILI|nr:glucan endo-1,3-beta-glucosidase 8 [Canna indica]
MTARWVLACLLAINIVLSPWAVEAGLGVNWGTVTTHRLPHDTIKQLLQDNGIKKVKIFDADPASMKALAGTGIEVMIAVPNDMLSAMNDHGVATKWVKENVTRYHSAGEVNIKYVGVGNEPFLKSYGSDFLNITFPALKNIQNALNEAGVGNTIKATIPFNADVYESPIYNPVPSAGKFRDDIADLMEQIVKFLSSNGAPIAVNIYPFLSLYQSASFPIDYAFFDGTNSPLLDNGIEYTNLFDANFDTLVSALDKVGFGHLPIMIGEIGWPTDGNANANVTLAERFYSGFLKRLAAKQGTPLRPNTDIDVYLFGLLDEDAKSVAPGDFERHWGIFTYDGQPKFPADLSGGGQMKALVGAKDVKYLTPKWCVLKPDADANGENVSTNVNFACAHADCTALGFGRSCGGLDPRGSISYAFNAYYQMKNQNDESCDFGGLATVSTQNISRGSCFFKLQIVPAPSSASNSFPWSHLLTLFLVIGIWMF